MSPTMPFGEVLEAAGQLSSDEQAELIAVMNRRLAQAARAKVANDVREARQESLDGTTSPSTPEDLLREILQ